MFLIASIVKQKLLTHSGNLKSAELKEAHRNFGKIEHIIKC